MKDGLITMCARCNNFRLISCSRTGNDALTVCMYIYKLVTPSEGTTGFQ